MPKIIVGVDESDRAKDAVALAAVLARSSGAELVLVNAYPYDDFAARGATTGYRQYLRQDAEKAIRLAQEGIVDLPAIAPRTIAELSRAKGIQTVAVREAASLIVIGSSHRGAIGRVLAGTTAERLLHGAPCPVAVAPNGFRDHAPDPIQTIAVAYNRSDEAKAALAGAIAIARALGARIRVIEVIDQVFVGAPAMMTVPGYFTEPKGFKERASKALEETVAGLPDDISAEPVLVVADPRFELASQSERADLMVVGSRGYGPHRAVLLGSISGSLVRDAACPVVVVPRGIEEPLEELFQAPSGTQAV